MQYLFKWKLPFFPFTALLSLSWNLAPLTVDSFTDTTDKITVLKSCGNWKTLSRHEDLGKFYPKTGSSQAIVYAKMPSAKTESEIVLAVLTGSISKSLMFHLLSFVLNILIGTGAIKIAKSLKLHLPSNVDTSQLLSHWCSIFLLIKTQVRTEAVSSHTPRQSLKVSRPGVGNFSFLVFQCE